MPDGQEGTVAIRAIAWKALIGVAVIGAMLSFGRAIAPDSSDNAALSGADLPAELTPAAREQISDHPTLEVVGVAFRLVPAGTFTMGCTEGDLDCEDNEKPPHRITLSRSFYMAETETTVRQFVSFENARGRTRSIPPRLSGDDPIVNVSWDEAVAFCAWVGGRLPTEAEWEYAARGGRDGWRYPWGNAISHEHANYGKDECCGGYASGRDRWENVSPVRSFDANGYGLYDMAGNVYEWVADWYAADYYTKPPAVDPAGPDSGTERVLRGGSWGSYPRYLRVSFREKRKPAGREYFGFRCARDE